MQGDDLNFFCQFTTQCNILLHWMNITVIAWEPFDAIKKLLMEFREGNKREGESSKYWARRNTHAYTPSGFPVGSGLYFITPADPGLKECRRTGHSSRNSPKFIFFNLVGNRKKPGKWVLFKSGNLTKTFYYFCWRGSMEYKKEKQVLDKLEVVSTNCYLIFEDRKTNVGKRKLMMNWIYTSRMLQNKILASCTQINHFWQLQSLQE